MSYVWVFRQEGVSWHGWFHLNDGTIIWLGT